VAAERLTDEELARRAQAGCRASFEELVRRFQVPLVHFLRCRNTPEDAEDLAQETFLRAYQRLHQYCDRWRFVTWLFTIARRLSTNYQRRQGRTLPGNLLETVADHRPAPGEQLARQESQQHLWRVAAEVLTEPQMTALWLFYVEEFSVKDMARVLGRSRVAVRAILFRARRKLLEHASRLDESANAAGLNGSHKDKSHKDESHKDKLHKDGAYKDDLGKDESPKDESGEPERTSGKVVRGSPNSKPSHCSISVEVLHG